MSLQNNSTRKTVSATALWATAIISFIIGAGLVYVLTKSNTSTATTDDSPASRKEALAKIPADTADAYARDYRGLGNWRGQSRGTWYESTDIKDYVQRITNLIDVKTLTAPEGYKWKFAVNYGAKPRKHHPGSDGTQATYGVVTMFMPVLVKEEQRDATGRVVDDNSNKVIDFFEIYRYRTKTKKPGWESSDSFRYDSLYKNYFERFVTQLKSKKDTTCPECLIFDEGHLFP